MRPGPPPAALSSLARMDRAADFFPGHRQRRRRRGAGDQIHRASRPDGYTVHPDGQARPHRRPARRAAAYIGLQDRHPPTKDQQKVFDKQLLLEATMAERGAFETIGPREVAKIGYIGGRHAQS